MIPRNVEKMIQDSVKTGNVDLAIRGVRAIRLCGITTGIRYEVDQPTTVGLWRLATDPGATDPESECACRAWHRGTVRSSLRFEIYDIDDNANVGNPSVNVGNPGTDDPVKDIERLAEIVGDVGAILGHLSKMARKVKGR